MIERFKLDFGTKPMAGVSKINKESLAKWIKDSELDEETTDELLKKLKRYPSAALGHFYKNILTHVARAQARRTNSTESSEDPSTTSES